MKKKTIKNDIAELPVKAKQAIRNKMGKLRKNVPQDERTLPEEAALLRLNKALKALSDSSQAVIRAKDESQYLNEVCRIIIEDWGYSMVWIGFAENNEAKSVRPAAYAGFVEGYLETLQLTWADTERGRGPTGTAIRTGNVAVCRNMLTDPAFTPWRREAIKRGYASSIVFPLRANNIVFGAINIYSKETDPFTKEEIRLLTELTDNVAYGIEVLRIRAAQERAEEALKQSERRYHSLFENMSEGFAYCRMFYDERGRPVDFVYLDVNSAFEKITRLKNVIGKKVTVAIPGIRESHPELFNIYGRVAATGKPERFEIEFKPLGMWLNISVYSIETGYFVAVFDDVTERKRTEARLTADLAALTRMHALSGKVLETGGIQPLLQEVMDTAVAIMRADRGSLQMVEGDSLRIVAHHRHQQPFLEFFASAENRASTCGKVMMCRERVVVPDIETSPLFTGKPSLTVLREAGVRAVQSTPIMSRTGVLLGIISTQWSKPYNPDEHDLWRIDLLARQAADLIEHSQAEQALRESEHHERERAEELAAMLEAVPIPVIIVHDPDSTHMTGNRAANELLRHRRGSEISLSAPDEVKPRHYRAIKDGRELRLDELAAQRAARGEYVRDFEFSLLFADGAIRHLLGYGTPLLDEQGRSRGAVHVLVDITDRKLAEEKINELNKELTLNVRELESSNRELEAFIYSIAHDLRAPLRSISGFSEVLLKNYLDKLDDSGQKYLSRVMTGSEEMNQIIDDLLHLSRISRHEIQRQDVDMSRIVQSLITELRAAHPDRTVAVEIAESIFAFADERLMQLVLSNLLGNAWKFTSKTAQARIEFGALERVGKTVYYIKDNGAGFDQNFAERIFLPFHRLHKVQDFEGTGIGLAIAERAIRRQGGRIWAEGKINEGAAFFFTVSEDRVENATTNSYRR